MSDREALRGVMERLVGEVWNNRRLDVVPEVYREDATLNLAAGPLSGIDAIRDGYMRPLQTAFPDLHHEIADLLIDGDRIAMRLRGAGTHRGDFQGRPATGRRLEFEGIALFRMEGGRIAEVWVQSNFGLKFAGL